MQNIRQVIEYFHLVFLDHLGRKVDKRFYILKGGCNLRFYFQSFRYSEDIDFDTQIIRTETLRKNVSAILESKSLVNILQANDIVITDISTPKQTTTTQRWKITLADTNLNLEAHTKIEFSRRGKGGEVSFEAINSFVTQRYHLPPIFLSHYDCVSSILQKVIALAKRDITQARDIFDLHLLVANIPLASFEQTLSKEQHYLFKTYAMKALANLTSVSYQDFQSQVVTYLATDYQKIYTAQEMWRQIIDNIKQLLTGDYNALK